MKPSRFHSRTTLPPVEGEHLPLWNKAKLRTRKCFVCGNSASDPLCRRPDGLDVVVCKKCRAIYIPRIPSEKELDNFYSEYSRTKAYLRERDAILPTSVLYRVKRALLTSLSKIPFGNSIRRVVTSRRPMKISFLAELIERTGGIKNKIVVEIGPSAGGGSLPELMEWGAKGYAVEVDATAIERLQNIGIPAVTTIDDLPFQSDIVYASMVMEHLADPKKFLQRISARTNDEARIIISVPNAGQASEAGATWIGFRVDLEHLNYFTAESLGTLLAEAGFYIECIWKDSQPILPSYLPMADRFAFKTFAGNEKNRAIVLPDVNPLADHGEFSLTVLARKAPPTKRR